MDSKLLAEITRYAFAFDLIFPLASPHSTRFSAGCHTSRDFVPWRFLDAGQLSLPSVSSLPASKNQYNSGAIPLVISFIVSGAPA
jgi:hypothetical protein